MPLITDLDFVYSTRAVVGRSKELRRYRVGGADDFIDYIETTTSVEYEYPGLAESAADAYLQIVKQNPELFKDWKISKLEDNRVLRSFKLLATNSTVETIEANIAPPPNVGSVTFSSDGGSVESFPQTVTISSSNPSDKIWYRIDSLNSAGNYTPGTYTEGNSNNITIQANTDTFALGYQGKHKQVRITAQARRTQLTGETYIGQESSVNFWQIAPQFTADQFGKYTIANKTSLDPGSSGTSSNFNFGTDALSITARGANYTYGQPVQVFANVYYHNSKNITTIYIGYIPYYFAFQTSAATPLSISGINHNNYLRYGAYTYRRVRHALVEHYAYVVLDGFTYTSPINTTSLTQYLGAF